MKPLYPVREANKFVNVSLKSDRYRIFKHLQVFLLVCWLVFRRTDDRIPAALTLIVILDSKRLKLRTLVRGIKYDHELNIHIKLFVFSRNISTILCWNTSITTCIIWGVLISMGYNKALGYDIWFHSKDETSVPEINLAPTKRF